jgi:hypothetical protein
VISKFGNGDIFCHEINACPYSTQILTYNETEISETKKNCLEKIKNRLFQKIDEKYDEKPLEEEKNPNSYTYSSSFCCFFSFKKFTPCLFVNNYEEENINEKKHLLN